MIYINILFITIIIVIITDQLEFWNEFSPYIKSILTGGKFKTPIEFKLFQCSTCQSHWINLLYIIILGKFTIGNYLYLLAISYLTPTINLVITLVETSLNNIIGKLIDKCSSRNNNIQD